MVGNVAMIIDNIKEIYVVMFEKIIQLKKDDKITTDEMYYLINRYSKYCTDDTNNATTEYLTGIKAEYHSKAVTYYMKRVIK